MSLKHYAILLKTAGFAVILGPLFLKVMGVIKVFSQGMVISVILTGALLLVIGNIAEVKAMRSDRKPADR